LMCSSMDFMESAAREPVAIQIFYDRFPLNPPVL